MNTLRIFMAISAFSAMFLLTATDQDTASAGVKVERGRNFEALLNKEIKNIWSGSSGGFVYEWTTRDIAVYREGRKREPVYSFLATARDYYNNDWYDMARGKFKNEMPEDDEQCVEQTSYRVASVAGPYLSLREDMGGECFGAHPFAVSRFRVMDMRKPEAKASLSDLFDEKDIFTALMADGVIAGALSDVQKALGAKYKKPTDLKGLLTYLDSEWARHGPSEKTCKYRLGKSMLRSFAFHHIKGNDVAVRIGLSHGCEVMRGKFTQLGAYLPMPGEMRGALEKAALKKEGFLMKGAPKRVETTHRLSYPIVVGQ